MPSNLPPALAALREPCLCGGEWACSPCHDWLTVAATLRAVVSDGRIWNTDSAVLGFLTVLDRVADEIEKGGVL